MQEFRFYLMLKSKEDVGTKIVILPVIKYWTAKVLTWDNKAKIRTCTKRLRIVQDPCGKHSNLARDDA